MTRTMLTGNAAAAWGARLAEADYVPAFPITPQTEILETLAGWSQRGEIPARVVMMDSEHSMLAAAAGAAATGVRVFTATSSQGLLYGFEMLYAIAGLRLPLVLVNVSRGIAGALRALGAVMRSAQIAGALQRILEISVQYANERVQFGRPIGKFQAIQQQLAVLAEHAAAATMAAEAAFVAMARGDAGFEIAVAKVRCGEAAEAGASIAHAVHGAIGFTYEHVLQFTTRRLWSWRAEFGGDGAWAAELGRAVAARGADALWADLTARA